MNRVGVSILLSMAVGCTLNGKAKDKCVTTSDCNPGNACVGAACVSLDSLGGRDGGQCHESFPPAECQAPNATFVAPMLGALAQELPGRWLFCSTDSTYGGLKFGPADSVGLQFNQEGSWSFVFADSSGLAFLKQGSDSGGPSYELHPTTLNDDPSQVDVDLHVGNGQTYSLLTQVADSPQRLRMVNLYGGINFYVWSPAPAGCGESPPDLAGSCGAGHDMGADLATLPSPDLTSFSIDSGN